MLVQFPYNLFRIISTVILVIYITSISVTTERKKEKKQPSQEMNCFKKEIILFPKNIRKESELTFFFV